MSTSRVHVIDVVVTFSVIVTIVHLLTAYYKVLHCDYNSFLIIDLLARETKSRLGKHQYVNSMQI